MLRSAGIVSFCLFGQRVCTAEDFYFGRFLFHFPRLCTAGRQSLLVWRAGRKEGKRCDEGRADLVVGSTICNTGYEKADYSDRSFITRMTDLGKPDIILVFGGTNDSWAGVPIGDFKYADWTEGELYDFRPAFCYLMDYLVTHYPDARIYNITNTELSEEVTFSMAEVCHHYGVTNIVLRDVDKQWGHPSVKGMASICSQVREALSAQ